MPTISAMKRRICQRAPWSGIVAVSLDLTGVDPFSGQQRPESVGKLHFTAFTGPDRWKVNENFRSENISAQYGYILWRLRAIQLLNNIHDAENSFLDRVTVNNAVFRYLRAGNPLYPKHRRLIVVKDIDQLL